MKRNFMLLFFLLICCLLFDSCGKESGAPQRRMPDAISNANGEENTGVPETLPVNASAADSTSSSVASIPFTFHDGDKIKLSEVDGNAYTFEIVTHADNRAEKINVVLESKEELKIGSCESIDVFIMKDGSTYPKNKVRVRIENGKRMRRESYFLLKGGKVGIFKKDKSTVVLKFPSS
jgi:hypothetical protein